MTTYSALPARVTPIDQSVRDRIQTDLDLTMFVEAGAGTGKTTALVGRIVALVARGGLDLDRLAAITFTEAAAAELRSKIRGGLDKAAGDEDRPPAARERCRLGASQVDLATIQTIHAFAATLLRTFPIDAGLPPGFQVQDQVESDLAFDERFRAWFWDDIPSSDTPEQRERRDVIRRALLLGMTIDHLRGLAKEFDAQGDLLQNADRTMVDWVAEPPPNPIKLAHAVGTELLDLWNLFGNSMLGDQDKMIAALKNREAVIRRLVDARDEASALGSLLALGEFKALGKKSDWRNDGSGQNPLKTIKDAVKEVNASVEEGIKQHRWAVFAKILGYARDFSIASAGQRRLDGVATFQDLLTWARDLLRDKLDVRNRARDRFTRIFVDEFQDTDPLQAEIVWFLASNDETCRAATWLDVKLEPGKLFIVGDPKQSIYRFRRADIGLYHRIYGGLGAVDRAQLQTNFRSVPAVIDWVNYQFRLDMIDDPGVQAPYVDLEASQAAAVQGGIHAAGGLIEGNAEAIRNVEAMAIARLAHEAVQQQWVVREGQVDWRSARYRDICVLLRSRTNARNLEEAFDDLAVPYRMESGSLILDTQEVRDALSCLRAIDDPSDQVALVAALRSPAYGCSDIDLLDWIDLGGTLNYLHDHGEVTGPMADAFASLRTYHDERIDLSVAALVERFIRERMLAVGAYDQPRPREAWRRLRYIVAQARTLAAAGRPTLRALVDWLERLQQARIRDVESPLPESDEDAVRIMTIHGAKGLEFPIVVVTGLNQTSSGSRSSVQLLVNRETSALELTLGPFETPGFAAARDGEKAREDAERVRLFYVAATRARDHLVLSLVHNKRARESAAGRYRRALGQPGAPPWNELQLADPIEATIRPRLAEVPPTLMSVSSEEGERDWLERRRQQIDRAATPPSVAASRLGQTARSTSGSGLTVPEGSTGDVRWTATRQTVNRSAGSRAAEDDEPEYSDLFDDDPRGVEPHVAVKIGRAVHAVLANVGPGGHRGVHAAIARALDESVLPESYADDIHRLVDAALRSPTVIAAQTLTSWREVSIGVDVAGTILTGQVDLLVEDGNRQLGIIDYKTDQVDRSSLSDHALRYRLQAGAYVLALQEITPLPVLSVTLVFAACEDGDVTWTDVDELADEARRGLANRALTGAASVPARSLEDV